MKLSQDTGSEHTAQVAKIEAKLLELIRSVGTGPSNPLCLAPVLCFDFFSSST